MIPDGVGKQEQAGFDVDADGDERAAKTRGIREA